MLLVDAVQPPIAPHEQSSHFRLFGGHTPFTEILIQLDGANTPSLGAIPSAIWVDLNGSHTTRHPNETLPIVNAEPLAVFLALVERCECGRASWLASNVVVRRGQANIGMSN